MTDDTSPDHLANLSLEVRMTELMLEEVGPPRAIDSPYRARKRMESLLSAAKAMVTHLNQPRDPADRAIVKPVFLSDEEWDAIEAMTLRGIADSVQYAAELDQITVGGSEAATDLRRQAERGRRALQQAGRRSSRG